MNEGREKRLRIGEIFQDGWKHYMANWKLLTVVLIGSGLASWAVNTLLGQSLVWYPIVSLVVGAAVQFVVVNAGLGAVRGRLQASQLLNESSRFLQFLVAYALVGLLVLLGLVVLIVPGIVIMVALQLVPFVVIDQQKRPIEALYRSADLTAGARWQLFWIILLLIGLNVVGAVAFGVGLLVTVPLTYVILAQVYEELTKLGAGSRVAAV